MRPYDLRHSYGTALYGVAGDTRLVEDVLGHPDDGALYTLGHVPEAMRLATSRIEELAAASKRCKYGSCASGLWPLEPKATGSNPVGRANSLRKRERPG